MSEPLVAPAGGGNAPAPVDQKLPPSAAEPAKAEPVKAEPSTLANAAPADDKAIAVAAKWPDDWRAQFAGEDKKDLKTLERIASPAELWKQNKELRAKLSSGEFKSKLADDATEEDKAAWRKENGIPDKPETYIEKLALPKGLVLGEADKPIAKEFATMAHSKGWTPAQFNDAVAWHYEMQDKQKAAQEVQDEQWQTEATDKLRSEFGNDFRRNITAVNNLVATMPGKMADRLLAGRMADGRKIGDDPEMVQWLAGLARELNPASTLVPASSNPAKGLADRIGELNKMISDRGSDYYRGPNAEKLQQEYRELLSAQQKITARAA